MKSFLCRSSVSLGLTGDIGLLILRVFVGLAMAFAHGLGKLPPSPQLIGGVANMGFPMPELFAWAAALAEFLGGIFIAIGLLTSPAALFLGFTMAVAAFNVHAADAFNVKEMSLLYLSVCVFFMLYGGGRFSLDGIINKK